MENEKEIEDERESMIMVTLPVGNHWYTMRFDCTEYLAATEKEVTLESFEVGVKNLRSRLLKIYDHED